MTPTRRTFNRVLLLAMLLLASRTPRLFGQVAVLSSFEGIAVATADRADTSRLTDAGVVSVEGASAFVVTLAGELRGRADRDGAIGLLLVPELPFFTSLYRSRKLVLSAAEFTAPVTSGMSSYFMSPSKHSEAGFPAYHLFLYNTTGAPATVNVYVYPIRRP
jgi:hypothetical protein